MSQSQQPPDDDFSSMLKRVRAASGTEGSPSAEPSPRTARSAKTRGSSWGVLVGPAIILAVIVGGVIGLASLSTWIARRMVAQGASADSPAIRRRVLQQQRLRHLIVPVDTTINPQEAGLLLHAIGRAGYDGPLAPFERTPQPKLDAPPCCEQLSRAPTDAFGARGNWMATAFIAARGGLTAEQRTFLRAAARRGTVDAFRRVARARAADLSAHWEVPADSQVMWTQLPMLQYAELNNTMAANVAAAVLDLAAGRVASAELRLREVISVGFLLQDGARSTADEGRGMAMVNSGRVALEALYSATGRTALALDVSARSDSQVRVSNANRRMRVAELDAGLRRRLLDTTELTGVRWQLLLGPFAYLPCTSVWTALFGPGDEYEATLAAARASLMRYPADERRIAMPVRGVPQMIDPFVGFRPRSTAPPAWAGFAAAVTRSRQLELCATMFRRM